ncbi:MAG: hypothetical protein MJ153_03190 [Clostridia bacterium]|nr:hypothetical protein [Clostridia bacterium]
MEKKINTYYMTDFFKPDDDNYYNGWYDRWGRTDYVVIEDGTIVSLSLNFS